MKYLIHVLVGILIVGSRIASAGTVIGRPIKYSIGTANYTGYLAYDSKLSGKRPGVIVSPEWWGITKFEISAAEELARRGYVALVIDLYGEGRSTDNPIKANELMQEAQKDNYELFRRFSEGYKLLASQRNVDVARIGAVGFGFGGGVVLDQARLGTQLNAVAVFYTGLINDGRVVNKSIRPEILVLTGEYDQYVLPDHIKAFQKEMKESKARFQVKVLKKAYPSFANPLAGEIGKKYQMPFSYDKAAADASWAAVYKMLERTLKKGSVVARR